MLMWPRRAGGDVRRALHLAAAGDHVGALTLVDPVPMVVASKLGLHLSVLDHGEPKSRRERRCIALAHAELGEVERALRVMGSNTFGWRPAERVLFAASLGRWAPAEAMAFMPRQATLARSALALRSGALDQAEAWLGRSPASELPDHLALAAALTAARGRHRQARAAANRLFEVFGLSRPLDDKIGVPISLQSFEFKRENGSRVAMAGGDKVTVVMPVRNGAVSVGTAIRSVLQQSWANLELIVVDDGSDDDTASVAITAAAGDQRVQLVRRSARGGAYAARNTGIALATGAYVTFNDGDDWSHPERLTRGIAPLLARPDLMATTSRLIRLGADGQFAAPRVFPFVRANLSSLLFRRQPVLRALGGFDEVPFGGDEEFIARLSTCFGVGSVLRLPTLLAVAMHGGSSLTGSVATGVGSPGGTRLRIAYRELWHRRHVDTFKSWQRGAPDGVRSGNSPGINWHVSKQPIGNAQDTS